MPRSASSSATKGTMKIRESSVPMLSTTSSGVSATAATFQPRPDGSSGDGLAGCVSVETSWRWG
jgi:hypothetical protein